tara:strand:+ start:1206 stop:1787 length:582 start_codon:yes stop_codon:yes gene_type:complete
MIKVNNIDKICKENVVKYPFEYILVEKFITGLDNKEAFEKYLQSQKNLSQTEFTDDGPQHVSTYLDILEKIRQKNDEIVEAINNVWNINCKYFYGVENMISAGQKLHKHNDYYGEEETPGNPFVRGVIYCNPEYVFGTEIYESGDHDIPFKVLGGNPGDLFLFRTGPNSWHSAVNSNNKQNRIVCSMKATTFE